MFPIREKTKSLNCIKTMAILRRSTGFTLLEIIITVVLIVIGITAITKSFNKGLEAYTDVENIDLALNIAQAKMEEIKNTAFGDLRDAAPARDNDFPSFTVGTEVTDKTEGLRQVEVTVSWQVIGGPTSIKITTLAADY